MPAKRRKRREEEIALEKSVAPVVAEILRERRSERSQVIIAASFLEGILEQVLWSALTDTSWKRELFEGPGPLASFSARIDVACALGLISESIRRDLHLIRKLRNHFAHRVFGGSLGDNPARQYLEATSVYSFVRGPWSKRHGPMEPGAAFRGTVAVMVGFLQACLRRARRPRKMTDRPLPPPGGPAHGGTAARAPSRSRARHHAARHR